MKRILILGSPGAGKSTFASALARVTGLPVVHLDLLHTLPGWQERPDAQFFPLVEAAVRRDSWIIDGNYASSLDLRLPHCDLVILFAFSRLRCVLGVLRRWLRYHGRSRPDMPRDCPEQLTLSFLRYVWQFPKQQLPVTLSQLQASGKPCQVLHCRRDAAALLRNWKFD